MELPAALRQAVDRALEGVAAGDLMRASDRLSQRYRAEIRDGGWHLSDDLAAQAYLTTRLPATYAAIRAALAMTVPHLPDFSPRQQLDLGAGPGTAFWASRDCWPQLAAALLLEGSAAIRRQGEALFAQALQSDDQAAVAPPDITWESVDLAALPQQPTAHHEITADLVSLCYVLDELAPDSRHRLIDWAWARCQGLILIVEPGTPAGWHRILQARDQLIAAGARIIAPCPHDLRCPLLPARSIQDPAAARVAAAAAENWCHFSRRVSRSRLHRLAKQADVPWEDEKFIFVAAARAEIAPAHGSTQDRQEGRPVGRIIAPVRGGGGRLQLQLCSHDGRYQNIELSKRDGTAYKRARRLDWGDELALD